MVGAMDRLGAMPRRAWVEIRDEAGELLESVTARIDGGTVIAELPKFPPGAVGTIELCIDEDGTIHRDLRDSGLLPTGQEWLIVEMG